MKQNKIEEAQWSIYIVKTRLDTLYTGISTDVERRFKEHASNPKKGARYLKGKGPLVLVWQQEIGSQSDALVLEYKVKKLTKQKKLNLIDGLINLASLRKVSTC